jgi:hypothetical protein
MWVSLLASGFLALLGLWALSLAWLLLLCFSLLKASVLRSGRPLPRTEKTSQIIEKNLQNFGAGATRSFDSVGTSQGSSGTSIKARAS